MLRSADYSSVEPFRGGGTIEIRALRPDDRADMLAAIDRTSAQSRQRRFFAPKRGFSDAEISFFMNVDFVNHVALVALINRDGRSEIVGGGRYVIVKPGQAEVAFVVVDAYQGQGLGKILMHHLVQWAHDGGLKELVAEVLPENQAMRRVLSNAGFVPSRGSDPQVLHFSLALQ
ncbi:RimJ/RimL family protein N-acetyltransferase [Nitrobacteraceae bacterium AZCC 1564]